MIPAVIAAAGKSSRMGPPKQLLPWGESTVLATVVSNLQGAGVDPVVCVLGREKEKIAASLESEAAIILDNSDFATTEMAQSIQLGLSYLQRSPLAPLVGTLISLGDQPHITVQTLKQIVRQIEETPNHIVLPSHQMRRGHPFYLPRSLWQAVIDLEAGGSLRQILKANEELIVYVDISSDEILRDIDTPEEYEAMRRLWDQC